MQARRDTPGRRATLRGGILATCAAAAMLVGASGAVAHEGTHGDDFATQTEVAPPPSSAAPEAAPVARAAASAAATTGARTVAVVMLNFASLPQTPWSAEQARAAVFTGAGSVNAFEQEQSYGALSLTGIARSDGDVFGWYTLQASPAACDPDTWMAQANAAAALDGVDLSAYQHHVYLFPSVAACGWAGLADMPGRDSFMNGTISTRVIAHELGHNIGAQHASTISCVDAAAVRVSFSASCTPSEYGDPFDVMGSSDRQSAAFRKVGYGFIPAEATATATQTGTYQIASSSFAAAGVRSLRVPRPESTDYWYLELRSPVGVFDDFDSADPAVTGVTVRLAPAYGISKTKLVDMHPATATFADAPLQPGESFTDPLSGTQVTVQSVLGGVATVAITVPGTPSIDPSPPAGSVPSSGGSPASAVATIMIRRTDRRHALVRVAMPVASGATRCATRMGRSTWTRCRVRAERVSLLRRVAAAGAPLVVAVRIDGRRALTAAVRLPRVGGFVRIVRSLDLARG